MKNKKENNKGGKIGFDGLAKKVAKRYEGKPVKSEFQDEYGKTYSKDEAMEVGRKVAGKVYRQQQGMKKGGKTKRSKHSLMQDRRRVSKEPWEVAYQKRKSKMEAGGTLPTPFGQAGLVGETGTMNEMDLFAMGGGLPQGVHQYYANTYNPAYPTPHGYAKGGKTRNLDEYDLSSYGGSKGFIKDEIKQKEGIIKKMDKYLNSPMENSEKEYRNRELIRSEKGKLEAEILHLKDELMEYAKGGEIDENKAHYSINQDYQIYVDSNFINMSQNALPNSKLKHLGFGEFYLETPNGDVQFIRTDFRIKGFVGRTHRLGGNPNVGLDLLDAMKSKSQQVSGERFAKGGKMMQGYNDRLDESLGNRNRTEPMMMQSFKDRRDESKGMEKAMGRRAYQSVGTMDKMAKGGTIIKKGNRVRVVNTQYDGKEGLVVSNDLQNGNYQVQIDGTVKGFPFENLMLLSRETYAKGGEIVVKGIDKNGGEFYREFDSYENALEEISQPHFNHLDRDSIRYYDENDDMIFAKGGEIQMSEVYNVNGKDYLFSTPIQNAKGTYTGWDAYEVVYDTFDGEKHLNYTKTKKGKSKYFPNGVKRTEAEDYFAKGGKMKQGYNDRLDESLGNRNSVEPLMMQSYKDRRDESKGMEKSMGRRAYQSVGTMDKMGKGGIYTVYKDKGYVVVDIHKKDGDYVFLSYPRTKRMANFISKRLKRKKGANQFERKIISFKEAKAQGYDDKLDESLGYRKGERSTKEQNYKDRRNESEAMEKKGGKRKYASVKTMDKGNRKKRQTPMSLAKEIRKEGEKWQDAVKRASAMLKKK